MATRNVIIGGGPTGTYAIDTIRSLDPAAEIALICNEPAYARMALPYYLSGEVPEEQTITATPEYFQRQRVNALLGRRAEALDTAARRVTLVDGTQVPYDNLLLATGSRAQRIPVPGADLPGVVTMWTLDDAHDALQFLPDDAQACIVGKGFIGGIILNALYKRGCRLKVVELADHVLPRMLDAEAATLVERWLTERGVELYLPAQVNAIHAGTRKRIELKDGRELEADLVVLATGIAANTELAQAAGIRVDRGILIDRHCATSAAGVFAGGDCAQGPDLLSDNPDVHAIQPTAVDHGRVAGANMAGRAVEYPGSLLLNILDVCGLQCASFGDWSGRGREQQLIVNETRPLYRKLVWEGDRIVGAIFVGPMDDVCMLNDVGMAKGFIQTRANLGTWKHYILANPADLRRPYVGVGVPERLVEFQLLGQPSRSRGYRYQDRQPVSVETEAHAIFVGTRAEAAAAAPPAAPAGEAKH